MLLRALILAFLSLVAANVATAGELTPAPCHGTEDAASSPAAHVDHGDDQMDAGFAVHMHQPGDDCSCDCPCALLSGPTAQAALSDIFHMVTFAPAPSGAVPPAILLGRVIPPLSPPPMMLAA